MSIDITIVLLLALSAFLGYRQGIVIAVMSPFSLVVTMLLAVQLGEIVGLGMSDHPLAAAVGILGCFLGIVSIEWLGLFGLQQLSRHVTELHDDGCIDRFLGGLLGLGRGMVTAWVAVVAIVAFEPQTVNVVFSRSVAAPRLLRLIRLDPPPAHTVARATTVDAGLAQTAARP